MRAYSMSLCVITDFVAGRQEFEPHSAFSRHPDSNVFTPQLSLKMTQMMCGTLSRQTPSDSPRAHPLGRSGSRAGSEAAKRRPAVVVSNDRANATAENLGRGVITVVPLTTN